MLPDAITFPENLFSSVYIPGWNLGDVRYTSGIQYLIEHTNEGAFPLDQLIEAHFRGNYGLINHDASDLVRTQAARADGRPFTGLWSNGTVVVKIVTNPALRVTTVCLACED